jgi:hypothetical protein
MDSMTGLAWTTVGDTDGVVAGAGVGDDGVVAGAGVGDAGVVVETAVEAHADRISAPSASPKTASPRVALRR